MDINIAQAEQYIKTIIKANLVPMLTSSPGIGKSDIVQQIAEYYNLELISIFLSHYDPTELHGFPVIKNNNATYVPFNTFPIKETPIPKNKKGFLLFFDEFNSAPLATQAAAYRIILDRYIGQYPLHSKTAIVCAGNLYTDNAVVNQLSTAMQSRLIHLKIIADYQVWLKWALKNNIDHRILAFLGYRPELLHNFNPEHNDLTFPCPRTYAFLSKLIQQQPNITMDNLPLFTGTIGEATGREFITYTQIYMNIPTIQEILNDPKNINFKSDPAILYALTNMIIAHISIDNYIFLLKFIKRLPLEFQTIILQNSNQRLPELINQPLIQEWVTATAIAIT